MQTYSPLDLIQGRESDSWVTETAHTSNQKPQHTGYESLRKLDTILVDLATILEPVHETASRPRACTPLRDATTMLRPVNDVPVGNLKKRVHNEIVSTTESLDSILIESPWILCDVSLDSHLQITQHKPSQAKT